MNKRISVIFVFIILSILVSCTSEQRNSGSATNSSISNESPLIGRWRNGQDILEFRKDGTGTRKTVYDNYSLDLNFTWNTEEGRLAMERINATATSRYTLRDGNLNIGYFYNMSGVFISNDNSDSLVGLWVIDDRVEFEFAGNATGMLKGLYSDDSFITFTWEAANGYITIGGDLILELIPEQLIPEQLPAIDYSIVSSTLTLYQPNNTTDEYTKLGDN